MEHNEIKYNPLHETKNKAGINFRDLKSTHEAKKKKLICDLLEIISVHETNNADKLILKERIEKNNGSIRIIIHPFYERSYPGDGPGDKREELVVKSLEKFIALDTINKTPIIIFEEKSMMHRIMSVLDKFQKTQQNNNKSIGSAIYMVPTYPMAPVPDFTSPKYNSDKNSKIDSRDASEDWNDFIAILKSLNVKKIIIGGNRLMSKEFHNDKRFIYKGKVIKGCVNSAFDYISKGGFNIEISNLAFPANRKEVGPKLNF